MHHPSTDGSVSSEMRRFVSPPLVWRRRTYLLALCSLLFLLIPSLAVADFSGQVISVLDGDTIEVLHNQHPERIRLSGIDCPEKDQAYGTRAKQAVSELAPGCGAHPTYAQSHGERSHGCASSSWRAGERGDASCEGRAIS
jgi:hypothetical protein